MANARISADAQSDLPSVSVVIPCWNAEKWVARAIQSVLDQDYADLEIVVVDDGSTDNSLDVIRSFGGVIRWEAGPNRGACAARNRGLEISQGQHVLFLDADDYIVGDFIRGLAEVAADREADIALGPLVFETGDIRSPYPSHEGSNAHQIAKDILDHKLIQTGQVLWAKRYLQTIGGWDEEIFRFQDMDVAMRGMMGEPRLAFSRSGAAIWTQYENLDRVSRGLISVRSTRRCKCCVKSRGLCVKRTNLTGRKALRFDFMASPKPPSGMGSTKLVGRPFLITGVWVEKGTMAVPPTASVPPSSVSDLRNV